MDVNNTKSFIILIAALKMAQKKGRNVRYLNWLNVIEEIVHYCKLTTHDIIHVHKNLRWLLLPLFLYTY